MPKQQTQQPFRLVLQIPLPPAGVNHIYGNKLRYSKTGKPYMGRFLKKDAAEYKQAVASMAVAEMRRTGQNILNQVKFCINFWTYWKDKRSQLDCDGSVKLVLDALIGIVYSSDKKCLPRFIDYDFNEKSPRMVLEILCPVPDTWAEKITQFPCPTTKGE